MTKPCTSYNKASPILLTCAFSTSSFLSSKSNCGQLLHVNCCCVYAICQPAARGDNEDEEAGGGDEVDSDEVAFEIDSTRFQDFWDGSGLASAGQFPHKRTVKSSRLGGGGCLEELEFFMSCWSFVDAKLQLKGGQLSRESTAQYTTPLRLRGGQDRPSKAQPSHLLARGARPAVCSRPRSSTVTARVNCTAAKGDNAKSTEAY
jgi:hypothetical protein